MSDSEVNFAIIDKLEERLNTIQEKLDEDIRRFNAMALHARINKKYHEASRLEGLREYAIILKRYCT